MRAVLDLPGVTEESWQEEAYRRGWGDGLPLVAPTPLLVVHGTVDPVVPPLYAQQVHDTAGDPKAMVWVETTNPIQIYDIEPQVGQATTALVDWLGVHMPA